LDGTIGCVTANTIILSGEPKSTPHIYRSACNGRIPTRYMSPAGKQLKADYQWEAKAQWGYKPPRQDELSLSVRFFFGTKRKADLYPIPENVTLALPKFRRV
jgi:hypothetical protein